jgi:hypothetical protein
MKKYCLKIISSFKVFFRPFPVTKMPEIAQVKEIGKFRHNKDTNTILITAAKQLKYSWKFSEILSYQTC